MSPLAILLLSAAAPSVDWRPSDPPTGALLQRMSAWTILTDGERADIAAARNALRKGDWVEASRLNRRLLDRAYFGLFSEPPTLPTLTIRPAGAAEPADPGPNRPISGRDWRREAAWLTLLAGNALQAERDFAALAGDPKAEMARAWALARLNRFDQAARLAPVNEPLRQVWELAASTDPRDRERLTALAQAAAPAAPAGPGATLSGRIGDRGRGTSGTVLPPTGSRPLPAVSTDLAPDPVRIEAGLALAQLWLAGAEAGSIGIEQARRQATGWIQVVAGHLGSRRDLPARAAIEMIRRRITNLAAPRRSP